MDTVERNAIADEKDDRRGDDVELGRENEMLPPASGKSPLHGPPDSVTDTNCRGQQCIKGTPSIEGVVVPGPVSGGLDHHSHGRRNCTRQHCGFHRPCVTKGRICGRQYTYWSVPHTSSHWFALTNISSHRPTRNDVPDSV